jgi:hypothetical protein
MEVLMTVSLIGLIAAVIIPSIGNVTTGVTRAKLASDVTSLNNAVSLYLAEGGNLDNVFNPQDVIDRLKTKLRDEDARRHVGPVSGRLVDVRLTARELTSSEIASGAPRAVWDATKKKFAIASQGRGVSVFYFDDEKANLPAQVESRKRSNMAYNGGNGWIWAWGGNSELVPAAISSFVVNTPPDPAPLGGNSGSGGGTGTSGTARFPNSILVGAGGADPAVSVLQYRLNSGPWQPYATNLSVAPGTRVFARNLSLDPARYLDSPEDTEIYLKLVDLFSGTVVPKWTDMAGAHNLVQTINNLVPDDVKATYGKPSVSGAPPNSLNFQRIGFISVPPDTDFKIGVVSYFNGTVMGSTEATSINLKLDMLLTKPSVRMGSATAHLSLWSSPNTKDPKASADYAQIDNPKTDFALVVDGVTYTLQLRFANVAAEQGWTDGTKLFVYEGSKGHADLIAKFVSSY